MISKSFFRKKEIPLIFQKYLIQKEYPGTECKFERNRLIWIGMIKPTPLSREYKIKIVCKSGVRPKVMMIGEKILGIEKPDFPHHFEIDPEKQMVVMCLHMPHEFDYSLSIAKTIIPWAQEWLYFYEIWLATGEWHGGGHHMKK